MRSKLPTLEQYRKDKRQWLRIPPERLMEYFYLFQYTQAQQNELWQTLLSGELVSVSIDRFRMQVGNVICPACQRSVQYTVEYSKTLDTHICTACHFENLRLKIRRWK